MRLKYQTLNTLFFNVLTLLVGPFDPLTPAAYEAVKRAKDACQKSSQLRNETLLHIDQSQQHQRSIHQLVNDGLTQKIAETVTLSVSIYSIKVLY